MIKIINPSRLARQEFFQDLLAYLQEHPGVILRQIKRDFPQVAKLDKSLDAYIAAGYIRREDKRYFLSLPLAENADQVVFDEETFLEEDSSLVEELASPTYETVLTSGTNGATLRELTDFSRDRLTLDNYFTRLRRGYPLTEEQARLYAILGDVNQEYALKYMTTFLLKYLRKDQLLQKRKDIFVDALLCLDYVRQNQEGKYELNMELDPERLVFTAKN